MTPPGLRLDPVREQCGWNFKRHSRALQSPETGCLWKGLDFPEIEGGGRSEMLGGA